MGSLRVRRPIPPAVLERGADPATAGLEPSDFQRAVADAFIRVMRARRPDAVWSASEPREIRELVSDPDHRDTIPDRQPRAAA